ncbi:MAG: hypothetical protein M1834_008806 [Cirrosporium novae-zelandiae]|nr:MAG: hypothetical protein M1834_008806 [Cirrosporium novae-zelandiae]
MTTTTRGWRVQGIGKGFDALTWSDDLKLPELAPNDVLVKFRAASLNYRDLIIPKGMYPFPLQDGVVPGSDGSGEVVATGERVSRFKKGDKVLTLFNQRHLAGSLTPETLLTGLGGVVDGALREQGIFDENGLVSMPNNLSYEEAATLPCAGVTAWNALYGLKPLKPGDCVLTQGTGGVSIFAAQFALAAGATVISTTSSTAKAETLKKLGVHHVINYREDPDWGTTAKKFSPQGYGVTHVIEVGGPKTIKQSLDAVRIDGQITIIGFVGGKGEEPSFLEPLNHCCIVRGILVGSRELFEDMNRAIEANNIKPVVDKKVFELKELKDAYQYMWDQKHFGKMAIKIA